MKGILSDSPTLVYIISAGHSGSTLLDFIIGSLPNVFSTGELIYFPRQLYRNINIKSGVNQNDMYCTCGNDFYGCKIWGKVVKKIIEDTNIQLEQHPFDLNLDIFVNHKWSDHRPTRPSYSLELIRRLNYAALFFGVDFIPNLTNATFRKRIQNYWTLINAIGIVSKSRFIVDSTKDPLRFRQLHHSNPSKVKAIILIREVFGVATSGFNYGRNINLTKNAQYWLRFYNLKVYNTLKSINGIDFIIIKYENLCQDPRAVRATIADFLETEQDEFSNQIDTSKYHLVAGNPMRYKPSFYVKRDERWKAYLDNTQISILQEYQDRLNSFYFV